MQWKNKKKVKSLSENVLLTHFCELAKNFKPLTLWFRYSMLKSTTKNKYNIDIGTYSELNTFLKREPTGFICKKSKTSYFLLFLIILVLFLSFML